MSLSPTDGGLVSISARVAEIQSRLSALQGAQALNRAGSVTSAGSFGSVGGVLGGSSSESFASVLGSVTGTPAGATGTGGTGGAGGTGGLTSSSALPGPALSPVPAAAPLSAASSVGASRALNAAGVPVDLARYGNGKIPASALAPLGVGNHRLWAPAAEAFGRMQAAATADGVTIGVTDSYRSYESQVDLARRKGLYSQGGLAARPGTSDHGWGMAVDLRLDSRAQAWMRANGARFGFEEDTPREPWHWGFKVS